MNPDTGLGSSVSRYLTTMVALAAVIFMLPTAEVVAESVDSVNASAYGVYANVDVNGIGATLGPAPTAGVPSSGGSNADSATNLDLLIDLLVAQLAVVDTGVLEVSAQGTQVGTPDGEATSEASVTSVDLIAASAPLLPNLLPAVVHADSVTASCEADVDGVSGSTRLVGAAVSGIGDLSASPSPNTSVNIPDVGTLWLNRQTIDSSGNLTVTGLQLILDLDLSLQLGLLETLNVEGSGIINVARAKCGVSTSQVTTTTSSTTTTTTALTTTSTVAGATSTTDDGASTNTSSSETTSTSESPGSTTTVDQPTTTTVAGTTTTAGDACLAEDEHDLSALASSNNGPGFGALRIGGSASVGDDGAVPVVLNILILLVAAALGAIGGYAIHKFGLFDRMARVKGAGL